VADAKPNPAALSSERQAMERAWTLIGDVLAGAAAIRAAGVKYLPRFEGEPDPEYERRKAAAPWRPEFEDALRSLASKPFSEDVGLSEGTSPRIKELAEDIDGCGNNLTQFAAESFSLGIAKGLHGIFVDYPDMHRRADGSAAESMGASRPLTIAEERAAGARPYWLQIDASDIVALYTTWQGGREVIQHVRIRECAIDQAGFGETKTERVRVYEPGRWAVWEKAPDEHDYREVSSGVIARGPKRVSSVPLHLFRTGRRLGVLRVKPPLEELAGMQIELYQALSRQEEVLTFAGSPMLKGKGMAPAPTVEIGPKRILWTGEAGADQADRDFDYIQPAAENIAEIRNHVAAITEAMRRLGMQPLTPGSGTPTATATSVEAAKAHSAVQQWALTLKDALEQALVFTSEWLGEEKTAEVTVSTDFSALPFAQAPLQALREARADRDISQRTYWAGLRRFDVLPSEFNADDEVALLAEEQRGLEPEEEIDPRTGEPLVPPPAVPPRRVPPQAA
jgi:hypothetical protein